MSKLKNKTLIASFREHLGVGLNRQTRIELIKHSEVQYIKISQVTQCDFVENVTDEIFIEALQWDMLADAIITCCDLTENDTL